MGVFVQNTHSGTLSGLLAISRISRILAQKCGPDPPFHTRWGPGLREFTSKLPQIRRAVWALYLAWRLESGIWNLASRMWSLESVAWSLELAIWSLEPGI